ncbi:MAG: hypothetical protein KDC58_05430 [Cyclobacteriaceae bacterium]|nr:hypothetical protein [Cyclobacteriaceae bacterium]
MLSFFKTRKDTDDLSDRDLDKIFDRFLSDNKISAKICSSHNACKEAIFKIANKIKWFQQEYNYVPNKAYLVLSKLSSTERKLIGQL